MAFDEWMDGVPDSAALFSGRMAAHVLFSLALVALADWFFYGHPVGWTLGGFGLLLGFGILLLRETPAWTPAVAWTGACYGLLCLRAAVDPEPFVVFMGTVAGVCLMFSAREGWTWSAGAWCRRVRQFVVGIGMSYIVALAAAAAAPFLPVYALIRIRRARGWLLPIVLGCLFLGLFAYANPVIALALSAVRDALARLLSAMPSFDFVKRCFFWLTVGAVVWAVLRHRTRPPDIEMPVSAGAVPVGAGMSGCDRLLQPEVIRNALILFNALFAVQTVLDMWYLWGGGALPQGVTYAGYAQRGAYPLVVTALLAAGFVLVTFRDGSVSAGVRTARWLVYGWLAQNVLLVVSAGWRLWLYVSVYSLSRLRLAAGVWMVLVACGLILILVRIWGGRSNGWLVRSNLLALAVALTGCTCATPNLLIAEFNVGHCREMGQAGARSVDIAYLATLGYDALPALTRLERHVQGTPLAPAARSAIRKLRKPLDAALRDWRGVTLKRRYLAGEVAEHAAME